MAIPEGNPMSARMTLEQANKLRQEVLDTLCDLLTERSLAFDRTQNGASVALPGDNFRRGEVRVEIKNIGRSIGYGGTPSTVQGVSIAIPRSWQLVNGYALRAFCCGYKKFMENPSIVMDQVEARIRELSAHLEKVAKKRVAAKNDSEFIESLKTEYPKAFRKVYFDCTGSEADTGVSVIKARADLSREEVVKLLKMLEF
jgi:hypothetical protein